MAEKVKRILVVSQHFWPEAFRINDIVEGFLENGVEVDVLCGLPNYPKGEWFEGYRYTGPRRQSYKGAEVFRTGEIRRKGNTGARIFLNYISFPFSAIFSLPRLARRRYDAVFCYETSPVLMMFPAILLAKLRRVPLTTYVLDLWPDNLYSVLPIQNKALRAVARVVSHWHYRRSDKLIALSDGLADTLKAVTRGRRKITVIPQYCEDFYGEAVADPALAKQYGGAFNILFAGNISPAQSLDTLVDAMALLRAESITGIRCIIVGDGMARESLQASIREKGLEAVFTFPGSCAPQDIPRWTGIAGALYAGLAKSANLGLTVPAKIPSYMAAGRPMLVSADGEANRVCRESGAALTSPAGDAAALAANIRTLRAMDEAGRAAMGQKGREAWQKHYSRGKLLGQLQHFILEA